MPIFQHGVWPVFWCYAGRSGCCRWCRSSVSDGGRRYRNAAGARDAPFRNRLAGLALNAQIERGDHTVVVLTTTGFSTWDNFKHTVRDWVGRDITFHWLIRGQQWSCMDGELADAVLGFIESDDTPFISAARASPNDGAKSVVSR